MAVEGGFVREVLRTAGTAGPMMSRTDKRPINIGGCYYEQSAQRHQRFVLSCRLSLFCRAAYPREGKERGPPLSRRPPLSCFARGVCPKNTPSLLFPVQAFSATDRYEQESYLATP